MSIGGPGLGKGPGVGGLNIGAGGLVRDWGLSAPAVRITAPLDGADVIGTTPWNSTGTDAIEASLDGATWIPQRSGMLADFGAQWTGIAVDGAVPLQVRLIADTGVTDSKTYTKRDDTLTITGPAADSDIKPTDVPTYTSVLPAQARIVVQGGSSSAWRDVAGGETFDELAQPPGGGLSIFPSLAGTEILVEYRLRDHPQQQDTRRFFRSGTLTIDAPAADSVVLGPDLITFTTDGGGVRTSCDGGTTWVTHATVAGVHQVSVSALGATPTDGGLFTVLARLHHSDNWEDTRQFMRSYELTITAPPAGADVNLTDQLDFTLFGSAGTPEAKLTTETIWVVWDNTKSFGDLTNWAGTADGPVTVEMRMQEDTSQTDSRAYVKIAVPSVAITGPAAGSDIFGDTTTIVVSATSTAEVSWNNSTWSVYSAGARADSIAGWSGVADGTQTLYARLQADAGVTDQRAFNKLTRSITIANPTPGSTVYNDTPLNLGLVNGSAEARFGTDAWVPHVQGMRLDQLPGFTAALDGAVTLEARVVEDNTLTDSVGVTKATRSLAITAPADGDPVRGTDVITVTSANTTLQARIGNAAAWAAFTSGSTFNSVSGWTSVVDGGAVAFQVRSTEDPGSVTDSHNYTRVQHAITGPAADAAVESTAFVTTASTGGETAAEAQITGDVSWIQASVAGVQFGSLEGFPALAHDDAFTVDSRLIAYPGVTDQRAFRRAAPLAITSPAPAAIVGSTTPIDLQEDGFSPEVRINTEAWHPWTGGTRFVDLPGWSALSSSEVFTLEARLAGALGVTPVSQSQTRQLIAATAFPEAGAIQEPREAATTITITAPLDGAIDIDDTTPWSVTASRGSQYVEVSCDGVNWLNATSGTMDQVPGFTGIGAGLAFTLQARFSLNHWLTDTVNLTKIGVPQVYAIVINSPAPAAVIGPADTFNVSSTFGGVPGGTPQVRVDGGTWETVANDTDLAFSTLAEWGTISAGAGFTLEARVLEDVTKTDGPIALTRTSYTIAINAPLDGTTNITGATIFNVQSQLDGSDTDTPQVRIDGGTWETVPNAADTAFSTLTDFAGVADGAGFTLEARVLEQPAITDGPISLTKAAAVVTPSDVWHDDLVVPAQVAGGAQVIPISLNGNTPKYVRIHMTGTAAVAGTEDGHYQSSIGWWTDDGTNQLQYCLANRADTGQVGDTRRHIRSDCAVHEVLQSGAEGAHASVSVAPDQITLTWSAPPTQANHMQIFVLGGPDYQVHAKKRSAAITNDLVNNGFDPQLVEAVSASMGGGAMNENQAYAGSAVNIGFWLKSGNNAYSMLSAHQQGADAYTLNRQSVQFCGMSSFNNRSTATYALEVTASTTTSYTITGENPPDPANGYYIAHNFGSNGVSLEQVLPPQATGAVPYPNGGGWAPGVAFYLGGANNVVPGNAVILGSTTNFSFGMLSVKGQSTLSARSEKDANPFATASVYHTDRFAMSRDGDGTLQAYGSGALTATGVEIDWQMLPLNSNDYYGGLLQIQTRHT